MMSDRLGLASDEEDDDVQSRVAPTTPCSDDDGEEEEEAGLKSQKPFVRSLHRAPPTLPPGQRTLCFQKQVQPAPACQISSSMDCCLQDEGAAVVARDVGSGETGAPEAERLERLVFGDVGATTSWVLTSSSSSSSSSSEDSDLDGQHPGFRSSMELPVPSGLCSAAMTKEVDAPKSELKMQDGSGQVCEKVDTAVLESKTPLPTLADHRQRSRTRSPVRVGVRAQPTPPCVLEAVTAPVMSLRRDEYSMPACPPGTEHWMEPLWAAFEPAMRERGQCLRRPTLESLCSGTAAELHAVEVVGVLLPLRGLSQGWKFGRGLGRLEVKDLHMLV